MLKRTCNPSVEISGQTLMAYLDNPMAFVTRPAFKKYGMEIIDPAKWYPVQPLLDVLYEIGTQPNGSQSLIAIGVKIAEHGVEAAETNKASLSVVLENWEKHLYANVRNGDVGHIITEKISDTSYRISQQNIFPDDLCYGLAFGFARSRLPLGTNFKVSYEDNNKRIDLGTSDKTVILVSWG